MEVKFFLNVAPELRKLVDNYFDFTSLTFKDENLDVLQNYFDCFSPKLDYNRKTKIFKLACGNNQLETAQWLVKTFDMDRTIARDNKYAFRSACCKGHLKMAKWLFNEFELTYDDLYSDDTSLSEKLPNGRNRYNIVQNVASNGHLKVLQWLAVSLGIDKIHDIFDQIFLNACLSGKIEIAEWVCNRLSRGEKLILAMSIGQHIPLICGNGHLNIAKLLYDMLECSELASSVLTEARSILNNRFNYREALYEVCHKGHIEIVKWILKSFPRLSGDNLVYARRRAEANCHVDIEELITDYFRNR